MSFIINPDKNIKKIKNIIAEQTNVIKKARGNLRLKRFLKDSNEKNLLHQTLFDLDSANSNLEKILESLNKEVKDIVEKKTLTELYQENKNRFIELKSKIDKIKDTEKKEKFRNELSILSRSFKGTDIIVMKKEIDKLEKKLKGS